ncbi:hypothetical protein [Lentilactobacillus hilgardii]|uniref:hypothetical protein n=1 Tax=Lentilactobacillus hilgardii TaxID=1588 RepID=UPI0021C3CD20|nr:hypothetical protein [Lentilactobacillus hilgardii]MCP9331885.1 hypothetical protein [Lentilactobacillus hilgardii]MCP9348452.1 hypothetical protein [Lentilactobacillus hilgardii]MCP9351300.1 hypothetical protein [Lentilactobacillus hilgardii]
MIIQKMSIILLSTGLLGITCPSSVSANSYLSGNAYAKEATYHIKAKKTVPVYKVRTGKDEAQNTQKLAFHFHKGSKAYISRWQMSTGGWIIVSKHKYYHTSRTFFLVPTGLGKWYQKI